MLDELNDVNAGEVERLRLMARAELERELAMLDRLRTPIRHPIPIEAGVICLILIASLLMFFFETTVLIWLLVAFILYCFNFIIWFMPTTRRRAEPRKPEGSYGGREYMESVRYILKRKKALGTEVALTSFLAGMVPLAISFYIIFGLGTIFAAYSVLVVHAFEVENAAPFLFQVAAILAFFAVLHLLRPQERGFSQVARSLKDKVSRARSRSYLVLMGVAGAIVAFLAVLGVLFVSALLMPGGTLEDLVAFLEREGGLNLILVCIAFLVEFTIMRHFQSVSSRRMAVRMLEERAGILGHQVVDPMSAGHIGGEELAKASTTYYNLVLFKVFEHNFYGRWAVYVVGPDFRILLDEGALIHL